MCTKEIQSWLDAPARKNDPCLKTLSTEYILLQMRNQPELQWRDVIWQELNTIRTQYEVKPADCAKVVKHMAQFCMDENRWEDALTMWGQYLVYQLSGIQSLELYYENKQMWFDAFWNKERAEKFFNYETVLPNGKTKKGIYTLPDAIVKDITKCQKQSKISDDEMRTILSCEAENCHLPITLFTTDEMIRIYFLERDGNTKALNDMYRKAKSRL